MFHTIQMESYLAFLRNRLQYLPMRESQHVCREDFRGLLVNMRNTKKLLMYFEPVKVALGVIITVVYFVVLIAFLNLVIMRT